MLIRIDPQGPEPLFEQIAATVRGAIIRGDLSPGARLPPARELADSLEVNLHTVLRGYQSLRDEGLVDLRRGRGAMVAGGSVQARARLQRALADYLAEARRQGLSQEESVALVAEGWDSAGQPTRSVAGPKKEA